MSEGAAERRTEVCGKVQWLNGRQGDPVSVQAQAGARSRLVEGDNIRTAAIGGVRRLVEHSAVSGLAAILAPGPAGSGPDACGAFVQAIRRVVRSSPEKPGSS